MDVTKKQKVLAAVRKTRLLPILERLHFTLDRRRNKAGNDRFMATHAGVPLPPLWWMHDMYSSTSYDNYWSSGKQTADQIQTLFSRYLNAANPQIAEWGCGMARSLRHFDDLSRVRGFDYNPDAVEWCTSALGLDCRLNALMPPLPESDDALDGIYSVSVFTHLSRAAHLAWADEIFRVLKPGGIFIATYHGSEARRVLLDREKSAFDAGELVVRGAVKEGSRIFTAYHPDQFVRTELLRKFAVREGPVAMFGQSLYVVEKPQAAKSDPRR